MKMTKIFPKIVNLCVFIGLLFLVVQQTEAARQTLGNITRIAQTKPNGVILDASSRAKIAVEFFDVHVVRVRVAPKGGFERDFSYAIVDQRERKTPSVKIAQTAQEIVLTNFAGAKIVIQKTPFSVKILDETGTVIVEDDTRNPIFFDKETGEIETTKLRQSEVETYYGFGEKAFLEMSRNGKFIVNWNTDTFAYPIGTDPIYQSIPFFYALHEGKTYGLFLTTPFARFSIWANVRPTDIHSEQAAANSIISFLPADANAVRKKFWKITPI